jgi:dolichol-phosphate mannosyltransferase
LVGRDDIVGGFDFLESARARPSQSSGPELSIVIPVYYNEGSLELLYKDIEEKVIHVLGIEVEIVFVDDGSEDDSWKIIMELAEKHENIKAIRLSRNFGSHAAMLCGLKEAHGACAAVKAADLQEPSELIVDMYRKWTQGNNVVLAVREDRADPSLFASIYYSLVAKMALKSMPKQGFDIYLVDRKVIDVLAGMDEPNSALTAQILWSGFQTEKVFYHRLERKTGKSRWTFRKKAKLFADTFFGFTTLPITIVSWVGGISFIGSVLWAIITLLFRIFGLIPVPGWTLLFMFNLFSFGVVMLTLGLLGGYLWRTFDASRNRPIYVVETSVESGKRS